MSRTKTKEQPVLFETQPEKPPAAKPAQQETGAQEKPAKTAKAEKPAKNAVVVHKPPSLPAVKVIPISDPIQIMTIISEVAKDKDANPEKMEKLLALQERILDRNVKAAFDQALAQMQPHLPVIERKGRIVVREKDRNTQQRTGEIQQNTPYAKWEDINEAITPILSHFGFALTFRVKGGAGTNVDVTGILSGHGHREDTTLTFAHDSTGSKNAAQAIVSSVSYGKRTVAGLLLNITTRGEDDDGASTGGPKVVGEPLTAEEVEQIVEQCRAAELAGTRLIERLNAVRPDNHPKITDIADLPRKRFKEAVDVIAEYEANRKAREADRGKKKEGAAGG